MWSLPDISRLNSEAAIQKRKLVRAAKTGKLDRKRIVCIYGPDRCEGTVRTYLVYDIFSDDPKELIGLCEHHDGYYGSPAEGYFYCDGCNRTFFENYTWELYYAITDCETLCLPCYAERELAEEENWIPLTDERIESLTFDQVRSAKHLIGVEMPIPKGIKLVRNVEFDSSTGGVISGFSSCTATPDPGVMQLKQILWELQAEGQRRAILILDAGYQFAVSIGVYVPDSVAEPVLQ